jgi:hypothetical protein
MSSRALTGVLIVVLAALSLPVGAESFCDPSLVNKTDHPTAYKERKGRCEGVYSQQVSTVSLDIRSLVSSFDSFDPNRDLELPLAWTAPLGRERNVRLRAFSFNPRVHYRMDTTVPSAHGSYRWPTDVLASQDLAVEDLGIIGWIELPGPGGTREVYLPLRAAGAAQEEDYEIAIFPSEQLNSVHVTISRLDANGGVAAVLRRNEELGEGYYPSKKPTWLSTGKLGPAGFYRIEITVNPTSGSPLKQSFELYHPGK